MLSSVAGHSARVSILSRELTLGAEVERRSTGRYGADVRPTPGQRSLTLYSRRADSLSSTSHRCRRWSRSRPFGSCRRSTPCGCDIFQIVIASLAAAVMLGLAHVRPPSCGRSCRLRRDGARPRRSARRLPSGFRQRRSTRTRSAISPVPLEELTARLDAHIRLLESLRRRRLPRVQEPARIDPRCRRSAAPRPKIRLSASVCCSISYRTTSIALDRLVSWRARAGAHRCAARRTRSLGRRSRSRRSSLIDGFRQRSPPRVTFVLSPTSAALFVRASPIAWPRSFENLLENATELRSTQFSRRVALTLERNGALLSKIGPRLSAGARRARLHALSSATARPRRHQAPRSIWAWACRLLAPSSYLNSFSIQHSTFSIARIT